MVEVKVHPRVMRRHPDVSPEDVVSAFKSMFRYSQRDSGEWVGVGLDTKNRILELVYLYSRVNETFFVYHAMPVTRKTMQELKVGRYN